jgi:hypothetical protein
MSVLYNGRPLSAPGIDAYDLELYPSEFLERAEVLTGARAVVYGSGESLMALNLVQPRMNVYGSYVRLWYIQGPNNTTGATILFDRNVGERLNLTLGFRRLPSDGEFPNQAVSNTAIDGSLTWNPSRALSLSLSEIYSTSTRGLNGGVTPTSAIGTPRLAEVNDDELAEATLRHDVTLSARWLPGVNESLDTVSAADSRRRSGADSLGAARGDSLRVKPPVDLGDTVTRFDASLYYTHAERSLEIAQEITSIGGSPNSAFLDEFGARGGVNVALPFAALEAVGKAELWNGGIRWEAGGLLDIHTGRSRETGRSLISLRPAVKLFYDGTSTGLILVGEAGLDLGAGLSLRGTLRNTTMLAEPVADCVPADPAEPHLYTLDRTAFMAEGALEFHHDSLAVTVLGFLRRTTPTLCSPFPAYNLAGGNLDLRIPYHFLTLHLSTLGTLPPAGDLRFPKLLLSGDLYGSWDLVRGNLNLRAGTTIEYQTSFAGSELDPVTGDFIYPTETDRLTHPRYPLWSLYAVARFGQAYVRVEYRNLLDAEYWTLYRYPYWGGALYLGATWALFD